MNKVSVVRACVILLAVALLEVLCRLGVIPSFTVIPPSAMAHSLWNILASGKFSADIAATLTNVGIAIAAAMIAGVVAGWMLVARDRDWYYTLVPQEMAQGRGPGASREALMETLGGAEDGESLTVFATFLFSHNTGVTILLFGLGFAFGIPTILLLTYEFATFAAMFWVFANAGLGWEFGAWLSIHGTTELFAALLGGAAGIHVGRSMAFPGDRSVLAAAAAGGRRAALVMAGAVLMLAVAGLLEGYGRQLVADPLARAAIGGTMLSLWLAYFALAGRKRAGHKHAVRP